ncbi:MAG: hypothetical protein M1825_000001 [Sarcosagium campestre]|nr:MAG: hypothetical protein M1825_000001 [Sarcosagium campestre]
MYYKRHEVQKRGTAFFISGLVAGAFGGLLAYALAKMDGIGNYSGWRWIFIIEGLLTIVVAIISKWLIADWPETAKFLNESEKALLKRRLEDSGSIGHMDSLTRDAALKIFKDWKIWICTAMYFCLVTSGYSTAFFIPTILEEFGYTASRAQVLTIPIYMANVPVALLAAFLADWFQHRYFFSMVGVVLSCMGYTILLAQGGLPVGVKYMAIFFVVGGIYITQPIVMLWMVGNLGGHYKRAFGTAMQIGIGNLGGILGSTIYVQREKPRYFTGYSVALALFVACGVLCTIFFLALAAENWKRDRGERDDRYGLPRKELENLGDDHPSFRFTL